MGNANVAFKFLDKGAPSPPGHKHIHCFFDVNMELTRKTHFVAGGHLTSSPTEATYASVVSRVSVCIAFILAALNNLDILAGEIGNTYLNEPTTENIFYHSNDAWGPTVKGRVLVIGQPLYGLKTSANALSTHFFDTIQNKMGCKFSLTDNDVWTKRETKTDGSKYYPYKLVYSDDALIISHDPKKYMD